MGKTARSGVERGYSPLTLRSAPICNPGDGQRSDQQRLTHPTVSSAANATNESGGEAEPHG
jgi:hypothetical protein